MVEPFEAGIPSVGGRRPLPRPVRWLAAFAFLLILAVAFELWRLRVEAFPLFCIPLLLACLAMSLVTAGYWREKRALPLSLVFALLSAYAGIEVLRSCGTVPAGNGVALLGEVLLWSSVPVAFGALAGLWRIFENHARFKQGQRVLLEHEARYRHLIENATDAFYAADADGRFTLVNAAAARLFGRRAADLDRMTVFDLVDAATAGAIREALEVMRTKDIKAFYQEFPIVRRDGTQRWVEQNLQPLLDGRHLRGFQAVLRDITVRREAQEGLRRSETRLRTLFETLSEGVLQTQADGRIIFCNPAAARILALPARDLETRHCADPGWEFLRPDGTPMPVEEWVAFRAHREKRAVPRTVTGVRRKDGSVCWLNACAEPILGKEGRMEGAVVTFADITQSKSAEENLKIIEFALDSAMEHVFLATSEGRLVYANRSAMRALEYAPEEILARTIFEIAPDVSPDDWAETWRSARGGAWPTFEAHFAARGGRAYPVSVSASYLEFNGREYLFAFAHDLSREAELATQLRHSQKMEAIGMLAGGIAHDFNNILGGVLGYAELALQDSPEGSPLRPFLQEILTGSHRAADLVRQILTFSRRSEQPQHPLRLAPVVKEALKLLRGTLPSTIAFREQIESECGPVMGDPGQIHQVTMNLCTNAYHAMREKGGTLTVGLREIEAAAEWTSAEFSLEPGRYAELSVADTGCGMDAETQRRIFEPFFTTKKQGEGTGLGLATVRGIVKSHKGAIRVHSEPGQGTRFDILLPLCRLAAEGHESDPAETALPGGRERVLLVDDEDAITSSIGQGLMRLGYTVETAANGGAALERVLSAQPPFDAVISDQTMPSLTGLEMARRLLRARPGQRIILCTGLAETVDRDVALGIGIAEVLAKPCAIRDLAHALRRVLDTPPAGRA